MKHDHGADDDCWLFNCHGLVMAANYTILGSLFTKVTVALLPEIPAGRAVTRRMVVCERVNLGQQGLWKNGCALLSCLGCVAPEAMAGLRNCLVNSKVSDVGRVMALSHVALLLCFRQAKFTSLGADVQAVTETARRSSHSLYLAVL